LSTTQLLDALLLVVFAIEADADTNPRVIFNSVLFVSTFLVQVLGILIRLSLNDESALSGGNKHFKY